MNNPSFFRKIKTFASKHKFISFIASVILILAIYYGYKALFGSVTSQTLYFVQNVQKGTIISSVSGSGQVSASNQIDIKTKVSNTITWIGVKAGDKVHAGQAIMALDSSDAETSILQSKQSLEASRLQYQKDSAQAPIDYQKLIDALDTAKTNLQTQYNDAFNSLSSTYLDLPTAITGVQNALYGYDLSSNNSQWNIDVISNVQYGNEAEKAKMVLLAKSANDDYKIARDKYDASIVAYKEINRSSPSDQIDTILAQSIDTATALAQALQSELNLFSTANDIAQSHGNRLPSVVSTLQSGARGYLSTVNSDLSSLLSQKKNIDNDKLTIKTSEQNITSLKVGNSDGSNPISLQISKNNLTSQENNLEQLKKALLDYTIVAPFDGTISTINFKKGETASGIVSTIISNGQIAKLSLNEVDTAKLKIGDKAILTFDAIEGLSMTGLISSIDTVGTVSQGVVSYTVTINFDSEDSRVKPGMTVNASIQTAAKQDVLTLPSSAVKTQNGKSYVQVFNPPLQDTTNGSKGIASSIVPSMIEVTTGISDDTNIEIISGLTEGQQIVSKTSTNAVSATANRTSLFGGGGTRIGGGGSAVRIP